MDACFAIVCALVLRTLECVSPPQFDVAGSVAEKGAFWSFDQDTLGLDASWV